MNASKFSTSHSRWRRALLQKAQIIFLLIGILFLGYYGYVQSDTYMFQAYQSWRLDQMQHGKPASISLYLKQWIPIPWVEDESRAMETSRRQSSHGSHDGSDPNSPSRGAIHSQNDADSGLAPNLKSSEGSLVGKIEIPKINLSAVILEGVQTKTLRLAVGHLPGTPMPGEAGNVELAAHRDTFFRGLRNVKKGDLVALSTLSGTTYEYRVESLAVVSPGSTDVLANFPGPGVNLITCYPFSYVGAAPERFVVHAVEVRQSASVIKNTGTSRKRKRRPAQTPRLVEVSTTSSVAHRSSQDTQSHTKGHFLHFNGIRTLFRKIIGGNGSAKPSAAPDASKGT